ELVQPSAVHIESWRSNQEKQDILLFPLRPTGKSRSRVDFEPGLDRHGSTRHLPLLDGMESRRYARTLSDVIHEQPDGHVPLGRFERQTTRSLPKPGWLFSDPERPVHGQPGLL